MTHGGFKPCVICRRMLPRSDYPLKRQRNNEVSKRCRPCAKKAARAARLAKWRKLGIPMTLALYDRMLEQQGGRCAICRGKPSETDHELAVDHDHEEPPHVRGLLCTDCNKLAVHPEKLRKALDYVLEWKARRPSSSSGDAGTQRRQPS
jgi:hypothetical protein